MTVQNFKNRTIRMVMDSNIVYLDGFTIKDRNNKITHPNIKEAMKNIDKYYIVYFNRDRDNGELCLKLQS